VTAYSFALVLIVGLFRLTTEAAVTNSGERAGLDTLSIWPAGTPGITAGSAHEHDVTTAKDNLINGRPVIRLAGVTDPQIILYRAPQTRDPEPAVVVFPGGGYYILAMDLEGTEICEWLNSIGVTAILLKYRVPEGGRDCPIEREQVAHRHAPDRCAWILSGGASGSFAQL
jgi:acetyl esterase/lipase